jgi:hypothetical protein
MFEKALIPVADQARYDHAKSVLEQLFSAAAVAAYLRSLQGSKIRVRDFEGALRRGLLGREIMQDYQGLAESDRGQIRELYLSMVERVAPELRAKFLKVYAYY